MNTYFAGQIIEFTALFKDDQGNPIDPTTVVFKYQTIPSGGIVTLIYTGATVPSPGVLARLGTGSYESQVDSTGLPGTWTYEWMSTGLGQTLNGGNILVKAALL